MKSSEEKTSRALFSAKSVSGSVRIHENVISSIIRREIGSIPGVARISGSSFVDNIAEIVGSKRIYDRAIQVEMGENCISVEVSLNFYYGFSLPEAAAAVQKKVSEKITELTGLKVLKFNVVIREIEDPQEEGN